MGFRMGYDVHVTRGNRVEISSEEWMSYIRSDAELEFLGVFETRSPAGERITAKAPGLARWTSRRTGAQALFDHRRGKITASNPDAEVFAKLHQVAAALGASVQGEEGEFYDALGNPVTRN
jgi:hypothetical protein